MCAACPYAIPTDPKLTDKPTMTQLKRLKGRGTEVKIMEQIGAGWGEVAIMMDFDDNAKVKDAIEGTPQQRCVKMFQYWLDGKSRKEGGRATWETLIQILKDSELITLASDIENILE